MSFVAMPAVANVAGVNSTANGAIGKSNVPTTLVAARYFYYPRRRAYSRSITPVTPHYMLPKTDPRRFNGPRDYLK